MNTQAQLYQSSFLSTFRGFIITWCSFPQEKLLWSSKSRTITHMHQQCPELPTWRWSVKWDGDDNLSPLLRGSALWRQQQVCTVQISCRMILVIYGCNTQPTSHSHMWYAVASLKKKKDISNPRIQKINNTFAWYNSFGLNILVATLIALPPKNNLWNYPRAWENQTILWNDK